MNYPERPRMTAGHFYFLRGSVGRRSAFDVVCLRTGEVIASLPYSQDESAAVADTRLLIQAFNRFYERGGKLRVLPFLMANSLLTSCDKSPKARARKAGRHGALPR